MLFCNSLEGTMELSERAHEINEYYFATVWKELWNCLRERMKLMNIILEQFGRNYGTVVRERMKLMNIILQQFGRNYGTVVREHMKLMNIILQQFGRNYGTVVREQMKLINIILQQFGRNYGTVVRERMKLMNIILEQSVKLNLPKYYECSSCLHRASMIIKHFIIQPMHNI